MEEEHILYVFEQLKAGHSRDGIRQILLDNGYDAATVSQLFVEAERRLRPSPELEQMMSAAITSPSPEVVNEMPVSTEASIVPPDATEVSVAPQVSVSDPAAPLEPAEHVAASATAAPVTLSSNEVTEVHLSSRSHSHQSKRWVPLVLIVVGLLTVVGVVAAAAFSGVVPLPSAFSGLFSSAPFEEEQFIEQFGGAMLAMKSAEVEIAIEAELVARGADPAPFPVDLPVTEQSLVRTELPETAKLMFLLKGGFDLSQLDSPNSKNNFVFDLKADEYSMSIDAELLVAENEGFFMKLNKFDAGFFSFFLPEDLPAMVGQWIQFEDGSTMRELQEMPNIQREVMVSLFRKAYEIYIEEAQAISLVTVATSPKRVSYRGGTAYEYVLQVNADALPGFYNKLATRYEREFGSEFSEMTDAVRQVGDMYDPEMIAYMNQYAPMIVIVSSEGVVLQVGTAIEMELPLQGFEDKQLNASFAVSFSNHNQPIIVEAPTEYITSDEVFSGRRTNAVDDGALIEVMTSVHSQSPIYFTQNDLSYVGICEAAVPKLESLYDTTFTCMDSDDAFALEAVLTDGVFCADSTGEASRREESRMTGTVCDGLGG